MVGLETWSATTCLVVAWLMAVAWSDWRARRIPNLLSLGAWLVGLAVILLTGRSLLGAPASSALLAAAGALLVTLPGYISKHLGAGDVKFLVATGLLSSWPLTLICFSIGALVGAIAGLLSTRRQLLLWLLPARCQAPSSAIVRWASRTTASRHIPMGTCWAFGFVVALLVQAPTP